jgi:hypothetical protein
VDPLQPLHRAEAQQLAGVLAEGSLPVLHGLAPFAAAPGPQRPDWYPHLVRLLERPEGLCGVTDFGTDTTPFVFRASAFDSEAGTLDGTMDYFRLHDGSVLSFSGRMEGNELIWWHEEAIRAGLSKPAHFHRARLMEQEPGRLEGTFLRRYGEAPGAGIVWLDAEPAFDARCRQEKYEADRRREARRASQTVARYRALDGDPLEITDASVSGLRAAGDPINEGAMVLFEDLRGVERRHGVEVEGCTVVLRRRQVGGQWLAPFGADVGSCHRFEEALREAWSAWDRRYGDVLLRP